MRLTRGSPTNGDSWRLLHLLGDGLVAFEPIGGSERHTGARPGHFHTDADRRRSNVHLRVTATGIRYSNGEVVAPVDFRRATRTGFPTQRSGPTAASTAGSSGARPVGTSPQRATSPRASRPMTRAGRSRSTWSLPIPSSSTSSPCRSHTRFRPPPRTSIRRRRASRGTGPYMLEGPMTDEGLALVRNPYFDVWSPAAQPDGYVDRIEWTFGVEYEAQIDAVAAGDADLAFDAYLAPNGSKISSYGPRRRCIPLRRPRRSSSCSTPR